MHPVSQSDLDYSYKIVTYMYPRLSPTSGLIAEYRSAAHLGLTYAARDYDPDIGIPWSSYLRLRVTWTVLDIARREFHQGGLGIAGKSRRNTADITVLSLDAFDYDTDECDVGIPELMINTDDAESLLEAKETVAAYVEYLGELSQALEECFKDLPGPTAADVMRMYLIDGMTTQEIGDALGLSQPNVGGKIRYYMPRIQDALREQWGDGATEEVNHD